MLVVIGTTQWAGPAGAQTVAVGGGGVLLQALTADRVLLIQTGTNGSFTLDLTSAAGDKFLSGIVVGRPNSTAAVAIT